MLAIKFFIVNNVVLIISYLVTQTIWGMMESKGKSCYDKRG